MKHDPERELAIFTEALRALPDERAALLDRRCGKDKSLRRKVKALLHAHDRLGEFLENPPIGGPPSENN